MKIIVEMNRVIQKYAPGQVGRYNDEYEPRAFGDNIQKRGTSTVLIESGGNLDDPEKQEIRRLNGVAILSAIQSISSSSYKAINLEEYENIPRNDRQLYDLKIQNVTYELLGKDYILDIGINHREIDIDDNSNFYHVGRIIDLGDLSTYYGYQTVDMEGYKIVRGKVYPETLKSIDHISNLDVFKLLKSGYSYIALNELPDKRYVNLPINIVDEQSEIPELTIMPGVNPNFLLQRNDKIEFAVVNGFLVDLKSKKSFNKNGLVLK